MGGPPWALLAAQLPPEEGKWGPAWMHVHVGGLAGYKCKCLPHKSSCCQTQ